MRASPAYHGRSARHFNNMTQSSPYLQDLECRFSEMNWLRLSFRRRLAAACGNERHAHGNERDHSTFNGDTPQGFAYAFAAYGIWGFMPIYLKMLSHLSPFEVLAHRVVWSLPLAALVLLVTRRFGDLKAAVRSGKP